MRKKSTRQKALPIDNSKLLEQTLTHRSFANDAIEASNERLEFLGDSILGMIIAEYLFATYSVWDQGQLSKAKASVVMETPLADAGKRIGLDELVRLGPGEEATGGRLRPSILGDAFEAVVAGVYLDKGIEAAREFVLTHLEPALDRVARGDIARDDYKSRFQEMTQARWRLTPVYRVVGESGSPHDKLFTVEVAVNGRAFGRGKGKSKKEAEQQAAQAAVANVMLLQEE